MSELKLERRGSGGNENAKLEHHEIVCPVIGAVNVYLQVSWFESVQGPSSQMWPNC
jgi:hypothetical protein